MLISAIANSAVKKTPPKNPILMMNDTSYDSSCPILRLELFKKISIHTGNLHEMYVCEL